MIFVVLILVLILIAFGVDYIFFNDINTEKQQSHIEQQINKNEKVEEFLKNITKR